MEIHLDLLGGLAGDMFIAALADAFPEHRAGMLEAIGAVQPGGDALCRFLPHHDGVLHGTRFDVREPGAAADASRADGATRRADAHVGAGAGAAQRDRGNPAHRHADMPAHDHDHAHHHPGAGHTHEIGPAHGRTPATPAEDAPHAHDHTSWATIRTRLKQAPLAAPVIRHATGIFGLLAEAEGRVHGVPADEVTFHEVGAWDSVADIVGAAYLIDALDARHWSSSAVPLGSGRIRTAHGIMPVPAPATALLLAGFATLDDGIGGERVTPTGAALLRYLCPPQPGQPAALPAAHRDDAAPGRVLTRTGIGFGTRRMPGVSNCVRVLAFDPAAAGEPVTHRELAVIEFEVDDQSAEDLAMGLDRLRAHEAVLDVVQAPVFGKKGRMMTHVRLLAHPARLAQAVQACFMETTTIGLRHRLVSGVALSRQSDTVIIDGREIRVKRVARPGGATAKAEADDVVAQSGHAQRHALRALAERHALQDTSGAGEEDA